MWLPTGLFDLDDAHMAMVDLRGDGIQQLAQHIARVEERLSSDASNPLRKGQFKGSPKFGAARCRGLRFIVHGAPGR